MICLAAEKQNASPRPARKEICFTLSDRFSPADNVRSGRLLIQAQGNRNWGYLATKRLMDVAGSLVLLIVLSPVLLATFLILLATAKGRPLFFQKRLGLRGRAFWMVKFRTMRLDADKIKHQIANEKEGPIFKNRRDPRVTRVGRFLRSTSIDELPQLFHVLFGRMSLVGPRPPIAVEAGKYEIWQLRRLAVKPGLTCLWQISGRSEVGFVDWVRMDLWYLKNQSLLTDLKILFLTPAKVLSREGAY